MSHRHSGTHDRKSMWGAAQARLDEATVARRSPIADAGKTDGAGRASCSGDAATASEGSVGREGGGEAATEAASWRDGVGAANDERLGAADGSAAAPLTGTGTATGTGTGTTTGTAAATALLGRDGESHGALGAMASAAAGTRGGARSAAGGARVERGAQGRSVAGAGGGGGLGGGAGGLGGGGFGSSGGGVGGGGGETLLSERDLKAIERENPEGLTSVQVVDVFARRGIRFSEATFRKFVQKGLLPRSRRVGRKGKHQGSLGLYPPTTVRRINGIKRLQAEGHTIEDIGRRFLRYRDEIEALERGFGTLFDGYEEELAKPHFDTKARKLLKKDIDETREHALELLKQIESIERRVVGPMDRPPGAGAPEGAEDLL